MRVFASWLGEQDKRSVACDSLAELLREVASSAPEPVIVLLEAAGAELHVVAGDPSGTVVLYYPTGYDGIGSLHSVGDASAAASDCWQPPMTAFFFGHHTEFPRWSVVPHSVGELATLQFCDRPTEPPPAVSWGTD